MARRRKIPVRKHHGVRDPLKQNEEKEKKLQNVVNNPPERSKDQKVSFKFAQFQKLVKDTKAGKKLKKVRIGREDIPKASADSKNSTSNKKFQNIKQFSGETDRDYLKRVNRITQESLHEARYELKYGVSVIRNEKTGEITIKKRPKCELDELLKSKMKEKRSGKIGKRGQNQQPATERMDPKLVKELVKQAIREEKEEAKATNTELQEFKHDEVKFGEVVHAPPTLSTLPRKAEKSETVPRPGKKNNLLLKNLITEKSSETTPKPTTTKPNIKQNKQKLISKSQWAGKRKELPAATRSMLETEQNKMIELYRQLKKSKETPPAQ